MTLFPHRKPDAGITICANSGTIGDQLSAMFGKGGGRASGGKPASPGVGSNGASGMLHGLALTTSRLFREEVLMPSLKAVVLVAFVSERQKDLESFVKSLLKIGKAAGDKLVLFGMNIDKDPSIAAQLGIEAVPSVLAFERGQPIDGFVGALDETGLRGFVERLIGKLASPGADLLAEARKAVEDQRMGEAIRLYEEILLKEPGNIPARGALARIHIDAGSLEAAKSLLAHLSKEADRDGDIIAARAALELAQNAPKGTDFAALEQKIRDNPQDWQAKLDLALAQNAKHMRLEAANTLLDIIKHNRMWNEDAARLQLLKFFEAWGPLDPVTKDARRRLSALLFR